MKRLLKTTPLVVMAMGVLLSSCKKEDETDQGLACLITKVIAISELEGETYESELLFTHTGDLLTKLVDNYYYEYCYFDGQETICESNDGSEEYRFTYSGNQLTTIAFYEDGELAVEADFIYSGGLLQKFFVEFFGETDEYRVSHTNGKISKIENWDNYYAGSSEAFELYSYLTYSWSDNNVTKIEDHRVYEGDGGRQLGKGKRLFSAKRHRANKHNPKSRLAEYLDNSNEYTYDDKTNPFRGSAFFFYDFEQGNLLSANNALSNKYTSYYDGGSYIYTTNYNYTYSSQGFPIEVVDEDDSGSTSTMEYNCQ